MYIQKSELLKRSLFHILGYQPPTHASSTTSRYGNLTNMEKDHALCTCTAVLNLMLIPDFVLDQTRLHGPTIQRRLFIFIYYVTAEMHPTPPLKVLM